MDKELGYKQDDDIEYSSRPEKKPITVWVSEDEKELYDLLAREYDIKVQKEMSKAMVKRLQYLRDTVIKSRAG